MGNKPFSIDILRGNAKVKTFVAFPLKKVFNRLFCSFGDKAKKIHKWKGSVEYAFNKCKVVMEMEQQYNFSVSNGGFGMDL